MPFLDHLEELRWRILKSLIAVVICSVIGWVIVERVDIIGLLKQPIAPIPISPARAEGERQIV